MTADSSSSLPVPDSWRFSIKEEGIDPSLDSPSISLPSAGQSGQSSRAELGVGHERLPRPSKVDEESCQDDKIGRRNPMAPLVTQQQGGDEGVSSTSLTAPPAASASGCTPPISPSSQSQSLPFFEGQPSLRTTVNEPETSSGRRQRDRLDVRAQDLFFASREGSEDDLPDVKEEEKEEEDDEGDEEYQDDQDDDEDEESQVDQDEHEDDEYQHVQDDGEDHNAAASSQATSEKFRQDFWSREDDEVFSAILARNTNTRNGRIRWKSVESDFAKSRARPRTLKALKNRRVTLDKMQQEGTTAANMADTSAASASTSTAHPLLRPSKKRKRKTYRRAGPWDDAEIEVLRESLSRQPSGLKTRSRVFADYFRAFPCSKRTQDAVGIQCRLLAGRVRPIIGQGEGGEAGEGVDDDDDDDYHGTLEEEESDDDTPGQNEEDSDDEDDVVMGSRRKRGRVKQADGLDFSIDYEATGIRVEGCFPGLEIMVFSPTSVRFKTTSRSKSASAASTSSSKHQPAFHMRCVGEGGVQAMRMPQGATITASPGAGKQRGGRGVAVKTEVRGLDGFTLLLVSRPLYRTF